MSDPEIERLEHEIRLSRFTEWEAEAFLASYREPMRPDAKEFVPMPMYFPSAKGWLGILSGSGLIVWVISLLADRLLL